jgi:hypothetical protein
MFEDSDSDHLEDDDITFSDNKEMMVRNDLI